ncbi:hypothetical protein JCM4814A_47450 [Streptomyces phaeofaciens JCM 4814]|uniref:Uncharacterized protein n=1 Tax=Streptomyces phaeofaciens TaxID=68254 RepID=A0A918H0Z5_9ACTN|nr:hypothetical protein GCM10010226_04110 [Streptomyces phaeofaciens]
MQVPRILASVTTPHNGARTRGSGPAVSARSRPARPLRSDPAATERNHFGTVARSGPCASALRTARIPLSPGPSRPSPARTGRFMPGAEWRFPEAGRDTSSHYRK